MVGPGRGRKVSDSNCSKWFNNLEMVGPGRGRKVGFPIFIDFRYVCKNLEMVGPGRGRKASSMAFFTSSISYLEMVGPGRGRKDDINM